MRAGLIVVNYQSSALLETAILPSAEMAEIVPIVVDNWSTATERELFEAIAGRHGWRVLCLEDNEGFGRACNLAAQEAIDNDCDTLVFLNPDASITADNLRELLSQVGETARVIAAPIIRRPNGTVWFEGGTLDKRTGSAFHESPPNGRSDWLTGACLAMTSETFRQVGGFDERYFLYWEDVDLTFSWQQQGGELRVARRSEAVHLVGATQGTSGKSWNYIYYNTRNRLLFARKHLGWRTLFRWTLNSPVYAYHLAQIAGVRRRQTPFVRFFTGVTLGLMHGIVCPHLGEA